MPSDSNLWRLLDRYFEESVACVCLSVVAILVFLQVVMRYGFNTSLAWTEELSGIAMVWAVYMGAALAVRERFHIRIMAGVVALPRAMALTLVVVADSIWLFYNLFMIKTGSEYLALFWRQTERSPSLGIDMVWPESIVVTGYVLMTFRLIQLYYRWNRAGRTELPGVSHEYQDVPTEA
ncbi:MAG: TRAP transporter small permease [Casimicrobiaceae bacterium]